MKASKYQRFLACYSILFFFPFLGSASFPWTTLGRAENPNDLAPCTLHCLPPKIVDEQCDGNTSCWCGIDTALSEAENCLKQYCTVPDILAARQLTTSNCGPEKRDKAPQYLIVNFALGTITGIITLSRVFFKRFISVARRFSPDDWVVLAAITVGTPCAFINRFGLVPNGIGKDAWALGPETVSDFAFYFYMMEVLYAAALALVKMTFIVFYFTIFTSASSRTWTRPLLWLAVVFDALLGIISVCVAALQCLPVSYYWTRYKDPSATGHCIPIEPMAWANGVLSVAFDVMIILIPLVEVSKMTMRWRKKASVIIMFLVGTFATIVSILRLVSVTGFSETVNITWSFFGVGLWSTVEINVGIICTSLPTMRLILVKLSPRVFGTRWSQPGTTLNSSADSEYSRRFSKGRRLSIYPDLEEQDELEEPKDSDVENSTNEKSANAAKPGGAEWHCSVLADDAETLQQPSE